ncbi:MAG: hypothetical protein ACFE85_20050 [Candidatus Hodarchaeota archaeon]
MEVNDIKGRPQIDSIKSTGYILWKHIDRFHLHWMAKGKKAVTLKMDENTLNEFKTIIKTRFPQFNIIKRKSL